MYTVGQDGFLIAWFNNCVLGKSSQPANPIFTPYCITVYAHIYVYNSISCKRTKISQFTINQIDTYY